MGHNINSFKSTIIKNGPELLTGVGIAGMIMTAVLSAKATPKALRIIEDAERENEGVMVPIDKFKACWKCYIPATLTGVASIACFVGANTIHVKRNATLATLCNISAAALSEYKDAVVETVGEKKATQIKDKFAEKKVAQADFSPNNIIITGNGNTLCLDAYSGRTFYSDIDKLKKAENEINHKLLSEMYISLNDFYEEIGLEHIGVGDNVGWRSNDELIELSFSSQLINGTTPCLVMMFDPDPEKDFDKLY